MLLKTSLSLFAFLALTTASQGLALAPEVNGRTVKGSGDYNVYGGKETKHSITLFGNGKGKYCINGSDCGDLYDIQVNGPEGDMVGKWNFKGTIGTFQWSFLDNNNFAGGFRFNQQMKESEETGSLYTPYDGEWKGRLD